MMRVKKPMMPEELTENAITHIIENTDINQLNSWEKNFFESVSDAWHHRHFLTDRQKEILGKIWRLHE